MADRPGAAAALRNVAGGNWLNWLLMAIPISLFLGYFTELKIGVFIASAAAIIPLARLMGLATEELTKSTGPTVGAFLNASAGNATELIIAVVAASRGLLELVKASITGAVIGNILVVLGAAMLVGGWSRSRQTFDRTAAAANSTTLFLAVVGLVVPAVFDLSVFGRLEESGALIERLSLLVAVVLVVSYGLSLVFSLRTHRLPANLAEEEPAEWTPSLAVGVLLVTAVVVAVLSELLVGSVETAARALGMTEFFVGMVIVALVGNAAEHASAVSLAIQDKMDVALGIAIGSSIQVALFVAPVLVFFTWAIGRPMSLIFNGFEIAAVTLATAIVALVSLDGESNWFEGAQLIAVYVILAITFYFVPA